MQISYYSFSYLFIIHLSTFCFYHCCLQNIVFPKYSLFQIFSLLQLPHFAFRYKFLACKMQAHIFHFKMNFQFHFNKFQWQFQKKTFSILFIHDIKGFRIFYVPSIHNCMYCKYINGILYNIYISKYQNNFFLIAINILFFLALNLPERSNDRF